MFSFEPHYHASTDMIANQMSFLTSDSTVFIIGANSIGAGGLTAIWQSGEGLSYSAFFFLK